MDLRVENLKKTGHRDINGWKNAGNPWTYKLKKEKMYLPENN